MATCLFVVEYIPDFLRTLRSTRFGGRFGSPVLSGMIRFWLVSYIIYLLGRKCPMFFCVVVIKLLNLPVV